MHVKFLFDVIVLKFWILHLNKGQAKFSQVTRYCFATCNSRQYMYAVLLSCSCTFIFLLRIPLLRRDSRGAQKTANSRLTDPYCWCSCPASGFSTDKKRSVHQDLVTKKFSAPSTTLYRTPWLGSFGSTQIVWQGQGQTKCRHGFLPVLPADSYGFQLDDPLL